MIAQLNKIWRVWACACAIARHSWPGLCICMQFKKFDQFSKNYFVVYNFLVAHIINSTIKELKILPEYVLD